MPDLPGVLFLTDPYHLCDKNSPRDAENASEEMQGAPCASMRGNSDDREQDGKAGGPGLESEGMKQGTWRTITI